LESFFFQIDPVSIIGNLTEKAGIRTRRDDLILLNSFS